MQINGEQSLVFKVNGEAVPRTIFPMGNSVLFTFSRRRKQL